MNDSPAAATLRSVMRHSVVYAFSRVFVSSLDLLLLPAYTRVLGPDEYGLVALAAALLAALAFIYPAGLDAALGRFFFDHETGSDRQRLVLGTISLTATLVGFSIAVALSLFGPGPLGTYLSGMDPSFFRLVVWTGFFSLFMPLWLQLLQVRREPKRYLAFSLVQAGLRAVLTIAFVMVLRRGAVGWIQAYLFSAMLAAIVASIALLRTVKPALDRRVLREALGYSVPLFVHQVAGWATAYGSRLVLNQLATLSAVGVYQVAFGIGQALGLVTTAVNFAYAPAFLAEATRAPAAAAVTFGAFAERYLAVLAVAGVLLSLFAREIIAVAAPPTFASAVPLIPLVVAAFVAQGFYYVLVNPIFFRKSLTTYLPIATVTGGVVSVVSSYLLIPRLGVAGAAWSGLIGNLAVIGVVYPLSQRALPARYNLGKALAAVAIGAVFVVVSRSLSTGASVGTFAATDSVLAGLYLIMMYWFNIVDRAVVRTITAAVVRRA